MIKSIKNIPGKRNFKKSEHNEISYSLFPIYYFLKVLTGQILNFNIFFLKNMKKIKKNIDII